MAVIIQSEANTANGGSAQGYLTGTDSSSAADTFYSRRLTQMVVNETFSGTPTVNTFTASTGGAGSASTDATFVLVPGTYRIRGDFVYSRGVDIMVGLYNNTSAAFEVYSGTAEPVIATGIQSSTTIAGNEVCHMDAIILVSTTNKTFSIRHKASTTAQARSLTFCGSPTSMTGANVNGAAAKNLYAILEIIRTA